MAFILQPLRIPTGWQVYRNMFYETELSRKAVDDDLFTDGITLFWAVHPKRRFGISMEWRIEPRPLGQFYLDVLYAPKQLTSQGRQWKDSPLDFESNSVHQFATHSQVEMVSEMENWLMQCIDLEHGPPRKQ